jgi:hypothetical protein
MKGIKQSCRPKLSGETRPSSNIMMIRHLVKLQPAYQAYVDSIRSDEGNEEVIELFDAIDWTKLLEFESLICHLSSWTVAVQTKARPMLSWNSIIPEILLRDFSNDADVLVIDLKEYTTSLKDFSKRVKQFPRRKYRLGDMSQFALQVVGKIRELCDHYLSLQHQGKENLLPALFLHPMAGRLMKSLNLETYEESKEMVRSIIIELAPMRNHEISFSNSSSSSSSSYGLDSSQSSSSSQTIVIDDDDSVSAEVAADLEIERFLKLPLPSNWIKKINPTTEEVIQASNSGDPTQFWKLHASALPLISRAARYFLCGSSSNATQERFFSGLNLVRSDLRSSLNCSKIETLTALLMNRDLFFKMKGIPEEEKEEEGKEERHVDVASDDENED